ncbi:hypothetical protein Psch_04032 [Pelotomaculum schinkii]|uniref:Uncharacterized protein n=1 Tax=Pelotomaculum schinkii TaxID=78350 RepID=A0A4Y7R6B9_9FIRM|nr:hypothetical protein [Pelotomaculum schinkii]TEB04306.1 hypothetical protein Psch_04032 [Pelotomaculum schinkii]
MKNLSDKKKINVLRIYADKDIIVDVKEFCNQMFEDGYNKYIVELQQLRKEFEEAKNKLDNMELERKKSKDEIK